MTSTRQAIDGLRLAAGVPREVRATLTAARRLVRDSGTGGVSRPRPEDLRTGRLAEPPVMLVHGLGANKSCLSGLERRLHRAGFTVYCVSYSGLDSDLASCAGHLVRAAAWLREATGAESAHLVAHSLGGVLARWAVDDSWMGGWVDAAITLGSPHRGTPAARLAPTRLPGYGRIIRELRPEHRGRAEHPRPPHPDVRWTAVAGGLDWVVPPRSARLPEAPNVRNVVLPRVGHLALADDPESFAIILAELTGLPTSRSGSAVRPVALTA